MRRAPASTTASALYITSSKRSTSPNPTSEARSPLFRELRPSVGPTVVSEITSMLTGSAPVLSTVSSCLASSSGRPSGSPSLEIEMFLHGRRALDVLVEGDGEPRRLAARGGISQHVLGKFPHLPAALRCELQAHDALPGGLIELHVSPVLLERIARQVGLFVDDVADNRGTLAVRGRRLFEEDLGLPLFVSVVVLEVRPDIFFGLVHLLSGDDLGRLRQRGVRDEDLVEAELGRAADNADHLVGVLHAGDLDHDLVLRLHPDVGLGHAEAVYALPDEIGRLLHLLAGHLAPACLGTLKLRADAALEVEAEVGGPCHRLMDKDEVGGHPE